MRNFILGFLVFCFFFCAPMWLFLSVHKKNYSDDVYEITHFINADTYKTYKASGLDGPNRSREARWVEFTDMETNKEMWISGGVIVIQKAK